MDITRRPFAHAKQLMSNSRVLPMLRFARHGSSYRSFGNVGSYAQFNFTGLAPGEYEVYTSYPALGSLGTAIAHEIRDGGAVVATRIVDQTVAISQLVRDESNRHVCGAKRSHEAREPCWPSRWIDWSRVSSRSDRR